MNLESTSRVNWIAMRRRHGDHRGRCGETADAWICRFFGKAVWLARFSKSVAKIDDPLLGPETLGARVSGYEATVAAVSGSNKTNRRIFVYLRREVRSVRDKGIVLRGDHQERHADSRRHALGAGVCIVILSVAVAKARGDDEIIELANGPNRGQAVGGVEVGKQVLFPLIPRH